MRILVTGGAGYIGSILVPSLLARGHQVIVLDNFMYQQQSLLDCAYDENLDIIRGDVRNQALLERVLPGQDLIIPLACLVGAPLCDMRPVEAQTTNYDAIKLLLKLRRTAQRIIFPTTNSGYGIGEQGLYCTEETPLRPISLYARLKVDIEKKILQAENTMTLRLATVFGTSPRMRLDLLVNDFTYRAFNDRALVLFESHFKRNFIHVRDVAKAFHHCIDNFERMKGQAYNVGLSDANLSKYELSQKIKAFLPDLTIIESDVGKDPDKRNYIVSNEKIERTGFKPDVSIERGIQELLKAFQILHKNVHCNHV